MRERGEFLESAEVHGNRYGTSKRVITEALERGEDLILEIDWQGARAGARALPATASASSSCRPRSRSSSAACARRGQDSDAVIRRRLANARDEMAHAGEFEYAIINKDFDTAKARAGGNHPRRKEQEAHGAHHR